MGEEGVESERSRSRSKRKEQRGFDDARCCQTRRLIEKSGLCEKGG